MKRLLFALCMGVAIPAIPQLMSLLPVWSGWMFAVQEKTNYLLTPGAVAGVVITGGVHDINLALLFALNVVFYSFLAYLVMKFTGKSGSTHP